ncbi:MAG: HAMP domain-containing protein [Thermoleophilia bacterium]|nr:HAMP domain-containing protein [Thermoleophilia bacterium]
MIAVRSLRARLSLALAGVVVVALVILYAIVVPPLERNLVNARVDQLDSASRRVQANPAQPDQPEAERLGQRVDARVVILRRDLGEPPPMTAVGDSRTHGATETAILNDPIAARAARTGTRQRGTVSRGGDQYAEVAVPLRTGRLAEMAVPVREGERVVLFVTPLEDTLANVRSVQRRVLAAGAVALVVALVLGSAAASVFARRLRRLERAADRIAGGDLDQPVVDTGGDEVGQLASAFEHMRRRLAQLDHARREFVANASHELRTPIFSLAGFLELLSSEELDEETRAEFLGSMQEQVERLTRLAVELLDLSRLDAGQLRVEREEVDLAATAEVLADEFRALARASGHELEAVVDADAPDAVGDGQRVLQIGRALVENALRHTPPGTHVRVRAEPGDGRARLVVEDDGPGIAAEHAEHVFERFYRVEGPRASGSGLGLAIARELTTLMDGRLELRSRPGRTTFTLTLPAAARAERRRAVAAG